MLFPEPDRSTANQEQDNERLNTLGIDYHNIKKAALVLRSLNHKLRQQLIKLIHENEKLTVTEIYVKLRLEQSVASQHLAILRKAGIVTTKREGKFIYYTINKHRIDAIEQFVKDLVN
ncbi:MAG: metalloregulator ArsR/SmtB family transcription factor [Bacteroidota bacterium]|nr:metalloregulator ArsR/SmtB family transcription factor [Bacteroidota bacterium]